MKNRHRTTLAARAATVPNEAQSIDIQAAGRTLSTRNAEMISRGLTEVRAGCETITRVLIDAGVIETPSGTSAIQPIRAGAFAEDIVRRSWHRNLDILLRSFHNQFTDLHTMPSDILARHLGLVDIEEVDRRECLEETIRDFKELLGELSEQYPKDDPDKRGFPMVPSPMEYTPMYMAAEPDGDVDLQSASRFKENFRRASWFQTLSEIMQTFRWRFSELHTSVAKADRKSKVDELCKDFFEFLDQQSALYQRDIGVAAASESSEPGEGEPEPEEAGSEDDTTPDLNEESAEEPDEETEVPVEASEIDLEGGDVEVFEVTVDASALEGIVDIESQGNLHPVRGVLFKVDELSESPPSVGPGLPLFVPRAVAERCLSVANLPLEAADNLSMHDRRSTCGVMSKASIQGNDFVVNGYLWSQNHTEKVGAILAASTRSELGMSMNAKARGHIAIIAGKKAFQVDDLELTGGCILYSKLATWKTTSLAAQAASSTSSWQPIAAADGENADPSTTGDESPMDPAALNSHLTALSSGMDELAQILGNQLADVQRTVGDVSARLGTLESDRQSQIAASAAQIEQQNQQLQQQTLIEAIGSAVGEQLRTIQEGLPDLVRQEVQRAINPRNVPPRPSMTTPLLAGAATGTQQQISAEAMDIRLRIATIDGRIQETDDLTQQISLIDEKRGLEMQLRNYV